MDGGGRERRARSKKRFFCKIFLMICGSFVIHRRAIFERANAVRTKMRAATTLLTPAGALSMRTTSRRSALETRGRRASASRLEDMWPTKGSKTMAAEASKTMAARSARGMMFESFKKFDERYHLHAFHESRQSGDIRLILMRHGASSWEDYAFADKMRPIATLGKIQAQSVASDIRTVGWIPDVIVSSDATRCLETLDAMSGFEARISRARMLLAPELYDKTHGDDEISADFAEKVIVTEVLRAVGEDDPPRTVMCCGHNFGFQFAAQKLCDSEIFLDLANAILLRAPGATRSKIRAYGVSVESYTGDWNPRIIGKDFEYQFLKVFDMFTIGIYVATLPYEGVVSKRDVHPNPWKAAFDNHLWEVAHVLNPHIDPTDDELITQVTLKILGDLVEAGLSPNKILDKMQSNTRTIEKKVISRKQSLSANQKRIRNHKYVNGVR